MEQNATNTMIFKLFDDLLNYLVIKYY